MKINYKNCLDKQLLEISNSVKNKETGEWECDILYNGSDLVLNTPKVKLNDNILLFDSKKRQSFVEFIEKLENLVVDYLTENSSRLFKGKKFTRERIRSSLVPSIYIDDNDISYIQTTQNKNLECFNFFLDKIDIAELEEDVTAEILINSVVFDKELFRIDYKLSKLKNAKVVSHEKIDFNTAEKEIEDGNFFE